MHSYVTFILSFMENNLLGILIFFHFNDTIIQSFFIIFAWMLLISCLSPFAPFIGFSFLNDLILLFGNSVIHEVNKTESPTSKSISCRNAFLEFSLFIWLALQYFFFWNWIKFLLESSLLLNEIFCYCNSEGNHWPLEEETILHLH